MDTLEKFTAAIAPIAEMHCFEYLAVAKRDPFDSRITIMMSDTAAMIETDFASYDEWQNDAWAALQSAGFVCVDSGANGGPTGGYYSVWSAE